MDGQVAHNLSAIGYTHDDQNLICEDCGHTWTCGVPIGEFDREDMAADLWCDSCDDEWAFVHRVQLTSGGTFTLHLKCPNCKTFEKVERNPDDSGVALVGYPQITGSTDDASAYGYED